MTEPEPVRLRRATIDDAAVVTEVFLASRAEGMPYLPRLHSDEETRAWITYVVLPETQVWVAESGPEGTVVGFASLAGNVLEHLYVRPDAWRRGIGRRLLAEVTTAVDGDLSLNVFEPNTTARAFYEQYGFEVTGRDDGSGNEEGVPHLVCRLRR